ncbi:MAG: sulfatase-like hydrolase/transferase [Planctomycetota bacterium]|jgi:arylsulfatase A
MARAHPAVRLIGATMTALAAAAPAPAAPPDPAAEPRGAARPPNIVLIMADDAGVEAFGCYGGLSAPTPHIDRLAAGGVRFTRCHAQPLCTPSRVKLLTGRSNVRNYVRFGILDPEERTIADVLRAAGYRTAVAGKWQLYGSGGPERATGARPEDAGFDEHCLWQVADRGSRYWKPVIDRNGRRLATTDDDYGPDLFCEFILDFIDRAGADPFFVFYPMALVHDPFVPTPAGADRDEGDPQANFQDMVTYADRIVGRIADHLEQRGLRDETLLVFTSDNGTHRSIRCRTADGVVRGGKRETTDTGTHVPLVVSWPGAAPPRTCDDLVDFADFLPTLAEAAGAAAPDLDGRSVLPQLLGRPGTPRDWIYCYYDPRPGNPRFPVTRFARDERWKLYADGRLFDLEADPAEETPVAADDPGRESADARRRLRAVIDAFPAAGERTTSGGRVRDRWGRDVSVRGITLVGRQGSIGRHETRFLLEPPAGATAPVRVTVTVPAAPNVYFRQPHEPGPDGPRLTVELADPAAAMPLDIGVGPDADRSGDAFVLQAEFEDAAGRSWHLATAIRVIDQDRGALDASRAGLPDARLGAAYRASIEIRGGVPPYRATIVGGALPPGLRLDGFTGEVTGVPARAGEFALDVRVEDCGAGRPEHPDGVVRRITVRVLDAGPPPRP